MNAEQIHEKLNSQTKRDFPSESLHALITKQAVKTPDKIAVLAGDQTQTYAELNRRSDQIANYLCSVGIGRGNLVGLCCNRDVDMPALLVGIMKAGAGYVPLDPDYPVERLAYMVENSGLSHILAHSDQSTIVEQFETRTTFVDHDWDSIASVDSRDLPSRCDPTSDVAYVIYTSGSTGRPKGVLVPHSAAVNMLWSMLEWPGFTTQDRILATTTLSFDISVVEMFLPLVAGGSVAIVSRQVAKDNVALVQAIDTFDVTYMQATPAMWRMMLEGDFTGRPNMKFITAGEPLPRDLIDPMLKRCREVWNLYGPTETTVYSSGTRITSSQGRILIGTPIANTQVFVVDENDQLCPPETPGELLIAGDGVTLGYLKRDDLNAEKFIQFHGHRVYRTGDLAQLTEDGQIDHLGRIDNQIKFHGHRIELGEIDAALAMQPNVRRASTVLREDQPGDKRLVGYLLSSEADMPNVAEIRENLLKSLPDYMVPSVIVVVDEFPHTPSGKLDRNAFPPPSSRRPDIGTEFVAPKTEAELQLAKIWSGVLLIERIGIRDNFFEFGGNSIRATKAVALMKQQMVTPVSVAEFFENPTIESILAYSENNAQSTGPRVESHSARRGSGEYAIVGMAAKFPGAANVNEFWDNLVEARESIRFFGPEELDATLDSRDTSNPNYVAARGIIEKADHFDARFFNTTPRNAELTDPQQRIMLELAWTALEDAGVIPSKTKDKKIGVWAGTYSTSYYIKNLLTNPEITQKTGEFQLGAYNEKDYIATRVAHALNLTGPAINVNTACSTSLVAVIEACKSLEFGHCDVALAGGASVYFPQHSGHLHQVGSIFSPDGHCRPFDADGAGTLFSDGAGVVVVKRLEDAVASKDRIYAVIKGFGINNDGGEKASFSAPSIRGQADAIFMAHTSANVSADTISYIEAHGTATPIGDPIEISALQSVFEQQTNEKQFCAIGSVKSNIGHTVAAAGVAGLIKVALGLHHEQIPPTLHFKKPNPQIDFANSPFFVCDSISPWERSDTPRRAGVSSFGVGGTNAHLLLEEGPAPVADSNQTRQIPGKDLPLAIIPLSGKTEPALSDNVSNLANHLAELADDEAIQATSENASFRLKAVAQTLQNGREEFIYRAAIVAGNLADAATALTDRKPPQFLKRKSNSSRRDVVFMFPGQGSQYVRMGQDLYEYSSIFRDSLDRCSEILKPLLGRDIRDVLFPAAGDEEATKEILKNTRFTQPALFALGYSLAQLWLAWGFRPKALMGHSIGEFAAACTAGVFSLEDGLKMIAERGKIMQALPGGSMMSVRLSGDQVAPLLWGDMAIGSYNGPNLCVVAGPDDQVAELQAQLESKEVVCRHLHTSHAFHSPMMNEIVQPFSEFVGQFELSPPRIPILSTVTGDWLTDEQATNAQYWADHLRKPVRFSDAVMRMWDDEHPDGDSSRILIELGPRKTLATLSMQHARDRKAQIAIPTLSDNAENHAEWRSLLTAVAQLWLAGANIDWQRISGDGESTPQSTVSLPTYAFQRKRYFIEPGTRTTRLDSTPTQKIQHNNSVAGISTSETEQSSDPADSQPEPQPMSRIPNIIKAIEGVFEDTSGFELSEFDNDTTFFEMGLDSLVLTQTATALKKLLGIEVTFRQLLEETPTVETLANWLDENLPSGKYTSAAPASAAVPSSAPTPEPVVTANSPSSESDEKASPLNAQHTVTSLPAIPSLQIPNLPDTGNATHAIVQSQLQLMAAQLQLLGGQPVVVDPAKVQPVSTQQTQPAPLLGATSSGVAAPTPTPAHTSDSHAPNKGDDGNHDDEPSVKAKRFSSVKINDGSLNTEQQAALDEIILMNNSMLPKSKAYAQQHRQYMADPRTVSGFRPNMKEMTHPIVVERSKGVSLWDIDGNEYIDFTCGFGSNLLGHSHEITVKAITEQVQKDYAIGPQSPLAGEVAKLFCELTGNERMAFSNTGSEAVLGCTRLARNATGRDLIVTFNGDYHGILDEVLVRGSRKQMSFPAATGIPKSHVGNTLVLDYGTDESLQIIRDNLDQLAAVLVEPVQSRTPELQPREFLHELRKMTQEEPTALIFDEVISGLRIGLGGAQDFFGVRADLSSYGKIVGGGMPIGVVAGKAQYMDGLDGGYWEYGNDSRPEAGMTYFAGTFVRHPLTLAASKAILKHLKAGGQPMYDRLNSLADYLADELNQVFQELEAPLFLANFGSLFKIQFHQELVYSEVFFAGLRRRGMHIWDHRPCLLTLAHEKEHIDQLVRATRDTIIECQRHEFMPGEGFKRVKPDLQSGQPPVVGAREGKDAQGNSGWFLADPANPGQFIQVGLPI